MNKLLFSVLLLVSSVSFAVEAGQDSEWNAWGPRELVASSQGAVVAFKQKYGDELYNAIVGVSVTMTRQGNSANAKVAFVYGTTTRVEQFFCHTHDVSHIDCH